MERDIEGYLLKRLADHDASVTKMDNDLANLRGVAVTAVRSGNNLRIRTAWNATQDMCTDATITEVNCGNYDPQSFQLINKSLPLDSMATGTEWKTQSDDNKPIKVNNSQRGGGHGLEDGFDLTVTAHGKTEADIGSIWNDNGNNKYIIYRIIDADKLSVVSRYTGTAAAPIRKVAPASPLTHYSGATHTDTMAYTNPTTRSIRPNINNRIISIVNDLGESLDTDGVLRGKYIEVRETYDIISVPALQAYLEANVGNLTNSSYYNNSIARYIRHSMITQYRPNGSCAIFGSYDFEEQVYVATLHFTQSIKVGDDYYIPNTIYDAIATQGVATITFDEASYRNPVEPPYRFYQFNSSKTKGMAIGHNLEASSFTQAERLEMSANSGNYDGSTHKAYPYLVTDYTMPAGSHISTVAFRIPFVPGGVDPDFTGICWYWCGEDIILMIDCFKTISKLVKLPDYMTGMKITPLDVHANVTIKQKYVESSGMRINVTSNYGYAVLKLSNRSSEIRYIAAEEGQPF
jgi:hypothetical protein